MSPELAKMMDLARQQAERVLIGNQGAELTPAWCLMGPDGFKIVATPFIGEESKEPVARAMRQLMCEWSTERYTLVHEAWLAHGPSKLEPRKRDDRIEVVMVLGCDREGSHIRSYEIVRDWNSGVVTSLKPLDDEGDQIMASGRFCDLL